MVIREAYLERIRPFYDSDFIKVIVGVRRCGKSVLLRQIADDVKSRSLTRVHNELISFEDYGKRDLLDPDVLFDYLQDVISSHDKVNLFLDEVQLVANFERVVNSIHSKKQANIFMTGSNSSILSGELETLLGGRTLSFRVMPFNFKEFCEFKNDDKKTSDELLQEFLKWGGMPLVCAESTDEGKAVVLDNLYSSVVLKDILNREKIASPTTLQNILDYLIANSSLQVSGNNIARELSKRSTISAPTVYDYINSIACAYIVDLVTQYDIRGKRALANNKKCYVCDLGFFTIKKNRVKDEMSYIIETAVYNELISRGYHVYVGKLQNGEIDFIAQSGNKRAYIQVAYLMPNQDVIDREFGAFRSVTENVPKFVISCDPLIIENNLASHIKLRDLLAGRSIF